jgi:hypothetical protein
VAGGASVGGALVAAGGAAVGPEAVGCVTDGAAWPQAAKARSRIGMANVILRMEYSLLQ